MRGFKILKWEYYNNIGDLELEYFETYPVFNNVLIEESYPVIIDMIDTNKKNIYNKALNFFSQDDFEEAFKLFLNLANYDYKPAMLYLERMYTRGWGTKKNLFQANKWKTRKKQIR